MLMADNEPTEEMVDDNEPTEEFEAVIINMGRFYAHTGIKWDDDRIKVYWDTLKQYPLNHIVLAINEHTKDENKCRFLPFPGDIVAKFDAVKDMLERQERQPHEWKLQERSKRPWEDTEPWSSESWPSDEIKNTVFDASREDGDRMEEIKTLLKKSDLTLEKNGLTRLGLGFLLKMLENATPENGVEAVRERVRARYGKDFAESKPAEEGLMAPDYAKALGAAVRSNNDPVTINGRTYQFGRK